ncbi:MAG TPA: ATP-binding protein, partial [Devosia sp.]
TGTALLFVFVAFTVTSVLNHRKDEGMQLSSFAGVIGTNSVDALMFNDRTQAQNTLSALKAKDEISMAVLFDRNGKPFAQYAPAGRADSDTAVPAVSLDEQALAAANHQGSTFWSTRMRLYRPVTGNNYPIGIVMIEADLTNMWLDILKSLGVIAAAMGGSLIVALILASRFKGSIADPVTKLINAAQKVSASQNYNLRIAHERTDELGTLIDSFNVMLAQIEGRGAALTHHRDELERQVGVRTEQLEKAKNAAEAASRAKSAFLATMSHEIRTPMNGVLGMTEMLLGTSLTDTQRNFTKLVKRSGEHLLVIINDILDFSKIEAGKLSIEYINFNLWDLLDDINNIYTPQAHAKNLALDFDIANDIPIAVCGDPNRVRQIIANLLGNAIKFTDCGEVILDVSMDREAMHFCVRDTGIGIPADKQRSIFQPFTQADSATTRRFGGTGLGLTISASLVALMGGRVWLESEEGAGSQFHFTATFERQAVERRKARTGPESLRGLAVLVVDDSATHRSILSEALASWQMRGVAVGSGIEALAAMREAVKVGRPFAVTVIDAVMPGMDGLALAAEIKKDATLSSATIMMLTSIEQPQKAARCQELGVSAYLTKPIKPSGLLDAIVDAVGTPFSRLE